MGKIEQDGGKILLIFISASIQRPGGERANLRWEGQYRCRRRQIRREREKSDEGVLICSSQLNHKVRRAVLVHEAQQT